MIAQCVAVAVVGSAAAITAPKYLPPGEVAGLHDIVLIYHGGPKRPSWDAEHCLPYVARLDAEGTPQEWLFDGFLLIEFAAPDGTWLHAARKGARQATIADWQWLIDAWFRDTTGLAGLDQAVGRATQALGPPASPRQIIISLPAPLSAQTNFGTPPGAERSLDFSDEADRLAACRWYMDTVLQRWRATEHEHLRLAGFYWLAESISAEDRDLVKGVAGQVHELGLRFFWIPYFGAGGAPDWRELGFDAMMLQPNHFFQPKLSERRLTAAARRAQSWGSGIEIEFDARAMTDDVFRERLFAYLDAGVEYGWMDDALLGYYEGGGAIGEFYRHPEARELYDHVCDFVLGRYQSSGLTELPPAPDVPPRDPEKNLALAAKGAKVHGGVRNQEELLPEKLIDGDADNYGGMYGFAYFAWPGSVTIELPAESRVARVQTLLWDLDQRVFRYRTETSLDGETWQPAVDKSEGEYGGWQVDRFAPRPARFVRFTGLHNSENALFQIVEIEVYSE
jgi:hypothetical protein